MNDRALGLLGIARKGGHVQLGEDPVSAVAQEGHARLMILAADAADHTVRRANALAALHGTPIVTIENDKASLGAVFGRSSVAMLAVTDINLAVHILGGMDAPERYQAQAQAVCEKAAVMKQRKLSKKRGGKKHAIN